MDHPARNDMKSLRYDLSIIDGIYENMSLQRTDSYVSLWAVLIKKSQTPSFSDKYNLANSKVRLTAQGRNKIKAELIVGDTVKEKLTLRGRVKDNYFIAKRKIVFYGLPFVFFAWYDYNLQFYLSENNELRIDGNNGRLGWIFIIAAGNKEDFNFVFTKM